MKKKTIIIISVIVIIGLIIGITYAWWNWQSGTNTDVTFNVEGASVTYSAGNNISNIKLIPVSSKEKGVSDNTAVYKEITASSNKTMYLTLNMALTTFPSNLADKSLVWEIYKGNEKIGNGNFSGRTQGNSITLLNSKKINNTTSTFKLYIWIDGLQDNPNTMQNQDFVFTLNASATDEEPQQPNAPKLVQGLIPVKYDTTKSTWVKANSTNENDDWYDYKNKQWANAVLVSDTNRSTYQNASAGATIPETDVLAYYVWIPRYKYKVWNINKENGISSYDAYHKGIDIQFENGTKSTGTISCTYDFSVTVTETAKNETCTGVNNDYYTHPAFWWDNNGDEIHDNGEELEGFWIGKFKLSNELFTTGDNNLNNVNLTVRIKPNVASWRYMRLNNFWKVIYDMQKENNIYGLHTSKTNTDSHMLKNMEWGAVAYLTNSDYGRCSDEVCVEVENFNTNENTGGNDYVKNINQSTTGNIYGIYDMNGGPNEFVMASMSTEYGNFVYNSDYAGDAFTYQGNEKYIDTYAYGTASQGVLNYNRTRLGDATVETKSWYDDQYWFISSSSNMLSRAINGLYSTSSNRGSHQIYESTRAALIGLQ